MLNDIYIYRIENKLNSKNYIGQTTDPKRRWQQHRRQTQNGPLRSAIKKHGIENFEFIICFEGLNQEQANNLEQSMIALNNTLSPNGYNVRDGGDNKSPIAGLSKEKLKERSAKISAALKGRKQDSKVVEARAKKNRGQKRSAEIKKKLSDARKGRKFSPLTDQHKENISKSLRGKKRTKEHVINNVSSRRVNRNKRKGQTTFIDD